MIKNVISLGSASKQNAPFFEDAKMYLQKMHPCPKWLE